LLFFGIVAAFLVVIAIFSPYLKGIATQDYFCYITSLNAFGDMRKTFLLSKRKIPHNQKTLIFGGFRAEDGT